MKIPLENKIQSLARRARRLQMIYAVSWSIIFLATAFFSLGLIDYLVRFQDPGLRVICSTALCLVVGACVFHFAIPIYHYQLSSLQVALQIERRHPELLDRLSSAVHFLQQPAEDILTGSAALQRVVIAEASGAIEQIDLQACLDPTRSRRAGYLACATVIVLTGIFVTAPAMSALAAKRLLLPWNQVDWPRQHELEFFQPPQKMILGEDFVVELRDAKTDLPAVVEMHYWFEGESQFKAEIVNPQGTRMITGINNVTRPFRFRAVGGDDHSMNWLSVELLEPPQLTSFTATVFPPSYMKLPPRTVGTTFKAWEGSHLHFEGQCSKAISEVFLQADPKDAVLDVEFQLSDDGHLISINDDAKHPWQLSQTGSYWLELIDRDGILSPLEPRFEIHIEHDEPPSISLSAPTDQTFVTPNAQVRIRAIIKDDLAIDSVQLKLLLSDDNTTEEHTVELYRTSLRKPEQRQSVSSNGKMLSIDHLWDLTEYPMLHPGMELELTVIAQDSKPQTGASGKRLLHCISPAQLQDQITQQQTTILSHLVHILRVQQQTRNQTSELKIQVEETNALRTTDFDQLQSAELTQRHVIDLLADQTDGVEIQLLGILATMQRNRLDSPELGRQMESVLKIIQALGHKALPDADRLLVNALKTAQATGSSRLQETVTALHRDFLPLLEAVIATQDAAIIKLESLLAELQTWDDYRRFFRDISRLHKEQKQLYHQTNELSLATLAKTVDELTPQQRADLKRLALQQAKLSRNYNRIRGQMDSMQTTLSATNPLAAETLQDALMLGQQMALGGQMRSSGQALKQNKIGQAAQQQSMVVDGLKSMLEILANRREDELTRQQKQLSEVSGELAILQEKQSRLGDSFLDTQQISDAEQQTLATQELSQQQRQLAEQTEHLSQHLQRLEAKSAAALLEIASQYLQRGSESAAEGQIEQTIASIREGEHQLTKAAKELRHRLQQIEQDLGDEQAKQLAQAVRNLAQRQQRLLLRTREIDKTRDNPHDNLSRIQISTVHELLMEQRSLARELTVLVESIAKSEAFKLKFANAAHSMREATSQLEIPEVGLICQQHEARAQKQLLEILQVLTWASDTTKNNVPQPQNQTSLQKQQNNDLNNETLRLAEMQLVKLMQEEILERTTALKILLKDSNDLTEDQQLEIRQLSVEQGRLAEILLDLIQAKKKKEPAETR
ncbi:MAG: hypothetical protein MK165_07755 [Pirellulaceae bacterium]|nr:hypothetical protein [Pirellulaceae bacterium]